MIQAQLIPQENRFSRNQGNWDNTNSTYCHLLYTRIGKCKVLPGYSKGIDVDEKKDKEICLQDTIRRLANIGYVQNCHKMEFFLKDFLSNKNNELILILYPLDHKPQFEYNDKFKWIIPFLDKLYEQIHKKERISRDITINRAKQFKKLGLDIIFYKEICENRNDFKNKLAELKVSGEIPEKVLYKFYFTYENDFKI